LFEFVFVCFDDTKMQRRLRLENFLAPVNGRLKSG